MRDFINNSWVIGISTGIIVFIVTTVLMSIATSVKNRKKKLQEIEHANIDIINSLKPYFVDIEQFPNIDIIESIISSVCRKYNIDRKYVYTTSVFCEELINDIIKSVYITSEKKKEYFETLHNFMKNLTKTPFSKTDVGNKINELIEVMKSTNKEEYTYFDPSSYIIFSYRNKNIFDKIMGMLSKPDKDETNIRISMLSGMISLLCAILSGITANEIINRIALEQFFSSFIILIIAIAIVLAIVTTYLIVKQKRKTTDKNKSD